MSQGVFQPVGAMLILWTPIFIVMQWTSVIIMTSVLPERVASVSLIVFLVYGLWRADCAVCLLRLNCVLPASFCSRHMSLGCSSITNEGLATSLNKICSCRAKEADKHCRRAVEEGRQAFRDSMLQEQGAGLATGLRERHRRSSTNRRGLSECWKGPGGPH